MTFFFQCSCHLQSKCEVSYFFKEILQGPQCDVLSQDPHQEK
jgi:hypothetical protein